VQDEERVVVRRRQRNMGEGAALRTPLAHAIGDISIVHDADLEYSPADIPCVRIARYLSAPATGAH
jgi:hypothetical protein